MSRDEKLIGRVGSCAQRSASPLHSSDTALTSQPSNIKKNATLKVALIVFDSFRRRL
jgi:hypothetical protein